MNHKKTKHYSAMKIRSLVIVLSLALALVAQGQTIIWTASGNPHVVSGTYMVPAGQTLVMEAGVIVNMQADSTLQVDGQLIGNGTAANHVRINGAPVPKRQWMFAAHRI